MSRDWLDREMIEAASSEWACLSHPSPSPSGEAEAVASQREAKVEALAAEVGPVALSIAIKMLGDRAAAEDAVQDAFVQAYRGLGAFRGEASLRTWFLRILVNCCRRHRRLWRRWVVASDEATIALEREESLPRPGVDPGLRDRLERAVLNLPHRQRTAFVLRYTQELKINEIAEIMGCAPGTVKATLHKAVGKLRRELGDLSEVSS